MYAELRNCVVGHLDLEGCKPSGLKQGTTTTSPGVIGVSISYHLALRGVKTTVIDRAGIASCVADSGVSFDYMSGMQVFVVDRKFPLRNRTLFLTTTQGKPTTSMRIRIFTACPRQVERPVAS